MTTTLKRSSGYYWTPEGVREALTGNLVSADLLERWHAALERIADGEEPAQEIATAALQCHEVRV